MNRLGLDLNLSRRRSAGALISSALSSAIASGASFSTTTRRSSVLNSASTSVASFATTTRRSSVLNSASASVASFATTTVLDPSKMANLMGWWRADQYDATTGKCADLSPNGIGLTFVTNKPGKTSSDSLFNNKPSVNHTSGVMMLASDANLAFGGVSQFEMWVVYKYTGAGVCVIGEFGSVGSIANSWALLHKQTAGKGPESFIHGNIGNESWNDVDPAAVKAVTAYGDMSLGSGLEPGLLINNVASGALQTNTANNTGTFGTQVFNVGGRTGGTSQFVGSWADVLVFKSTLSSAIRSDLYNNYLQPRYNL